MEDIKTNTNIGTAKGVQLPEKKFRAGPISATIWKNFQANNEGSYFNITLERSYKDKQGIWQHTNSLRLNDLPKAMLLAQKAYEYIVFKEHETSGMSGNHMQNMQSAHKEYEEIY
ncbi:MAG TPA: hypothetical protein VI894_02525 [Candidatus Nanoarchaeia archaeon]|nr:hypothetical protein [Candidatus Nanoarchaeia archaeon]